MDKFLLLKYVIMTITGLLLTTILMPFILLLTFIFGFIYLLSHVAIKLRYGEGVYNASGIDVIHGKETKNTLPVIAIAFKVQGLYTMEQLKKTVLRFIKENYNENGQLRYKKLLEVYDKKFGYNIWRPAEDFDIDDHVKEISLQNCQTQMDASNMWMSVVKTFLDEYNMKPFQKDKPQWEMFVMKGDKSFSVFIRLHHAIADGIYISRMFYEDLIDEPYILFPNCRESNPYNKFFTSLWSFSLLPFGLVTILTRNDRNPIHGPSLTGVKKYFTSNPIDLKVIQSIKKNIAFKVSSPAIAFSCISFTISKLFNKRRSNVSEITVLTPLPLQNKNSEIKLKNKFAVGYIDFPVPLITELQEKDFPALTRLRMVQNSLQDMNNNVSILPVNFLINCICTILPNWLAEALLSVKGCSVGISQLPGAKTPVSAFGGKISDKMFWIPDREPMGVGFSVYSFNGTLRAGLAIDQALLTSHEEGLEIMQNFELEMQNLVEEMKQATNVLCTESQEYLKSIC